MFVKHSVIFRGYTTVYPSDFLEASGQLSILRLITNRAAVSEVPASVDTCPVFYWVCTLKWDYQAIGSVYLGLKILPGQVFIDTETRKPTEDR